MCTIVDSHVHLWDPGRLSYPWLRGHATLNRPIGLEEYARATAHTPVDAMVFVQAEAERGAGLEEAQWVAELARQDPRIRAIVAWAPLYKGLAVREDLQKLRDVDLVRGVRQIIQFEPDLDFCLSESFLAGVGLLAEFDLSFDICVDHRHMGRIVEFAMRLPKVRMVLDHIGKPDIRGRALQPWLGHLRELAALPHVWCKVSGVATEAHHDAWTRAELARYIEPALDAFGFTRTLYGSDWPVSTDAIAYDEWIALLDDLLAGVPAAQRQRFWSDNAREFYRLDDGITPAGAQR